MQKPVNVFLPHSSQKAKRNNSCSSRMGGAAPGGMVEDLKLATQAVLSESKINVNDIKGIGISYQMHGLICVDKEQKVLRPAIIWCDARGVPYGQKAFDTLGKTQCLSHLLNSPGNFTATKLAWIKENEPDIFERIYKIILPGDYIAMKLSGEICTTVEGLSEGIFWDFKKNHVADFLMDYFGFNPSILADIKRLSPSKDVLMPKLQKNWDWQKVLPLHTVPATSPTTPCRSMSLIPVK